MRDAWTVSVNATELIARVEKKIEAIDKEVAESRKKTIAHRASFPYRDFDDKKEELLLWKDFLSRHPVLSYGLDFSDYRYFFGPSCL